MFKLDTFFYFKQLNRLKMGAVNTKPASRKHSKKSRNSKSKGKQSSVQRSDINRSENMNRTKLSAKDKSMKSSRHKRKISDSKAPEQKIKESSKVKPQSKQIFTAFGFEEAETNIKLNQYVSIPQLNTLSREMVERDVNYGQERNIVLQSKVLVRNTMMEYELDEEGGVADSQGIPTFCYGTKLYHDHWYKNRQYNYDHRRRVSTGKDPH